MTPTRRRKISEPPDDLSFNSVAPPARTSRWAVEVAADGTVAADVACQRCGYNLRALPVKSLCPECAAPVHASLRGNDLTFADPAWLEKLARGADILLIAGVAFLATFLLWIFLGRRPLAGTILQMLFVAALVAFLISVGLLTSPEPSDTGQGDGLAHTMRLLARWLVPVGLMWMPLAAIREMLVPMRGAAGAGGAGGAGAGTMLAAQLLQVAAVLAVYVEVTGLGCLLLHLRKLAARGAEFLGVGLGGAAVATALAGIALTVDALLDPAGPGLGVRQVGQRIMRNPGGPLLTLGLSSFIILDLRMLAGSLRGAAELSRQLSSTRRVPAASPAPAPARVE